ncbi:MAG: hypothetical protein JKY53_13165 [Flavobacteriales bacterium]|nr:hypothetical protein [Flavobacteriales bacterium]
MVEKSIESLFNNTSQIIYSLSLLLSKELIQEDNYKIFEIVNSFDTKFSKYRHLPFTTFKVFDTFGNTVSSSAFLGDNCVDKNINLDSVIVKGLKQQPFDTQIGVIGCADSLKTNFIPFCASINSGDTQKGSICSGLKIKELNIILNHVLSAEHSGTISIVSKHALDHLQNINDVFNLNNIINYYLKNQPIYNHIILDSYPDIIIEHKANFHYLIYDLILNNMYLMIYFIFSFILSFLIYYTENHSNTKILSGIFQKIKNIPINGEQTSSNEVKVPTEREILQAIEIVVDYSLDMYKNKENELEETSATTIRNNILHLMLTERHYSRKIVSKTSLSTLYLGQIQKLITSGYETENLCNFLQHTLEYCCEYFHELNIQIEVSTKDSKDFTFRSAALIESLFNIFSLIIRSSNFNIDENAIILKGFFDYNSCFPTISIETSIQTSSIKSLGWESGPVYIYSGFLSIHLLAKENNLILNIYEDKKREKIIFSLEPLQGKETPNNNNILFGLS